MPVSITAKEYGCEFASETLAISDLSENLSTYKTTPACDDLAVERHVSSAQSY